MWMSKQTDSVARRWSAAEFDPEVRAPDRAEQRLVFTAPKLAWFMDRVFEPEMDEAMRAASTTVGATRCGMSAPRPPSTWPPSG